MTPRKFKPALIALGCIGLAACQPSPEQDRAQIERDILATPGSEELWGTIKREYPADFGVLVDRVQALDNAQRRDPANSKAIGEEWRQEFFIRIAPDSVKAPAEEMLAWSAAEAQLYSNLQVSALEACADLTMGRWVFIDESNVAASRAVEQRNAAMVRAAAAGRDDPQEYATPGEADFMKLGDAIAETGIAPEIQETLGFVDRMAALSPEDRCELGVALYQGVTALPDEDEAKMAAFLLSPVPE